VGVPCSVIFRGQVSQVRWSCGWVPWSAVHHCPRWVDCLGGFVLPGGLTRFTWLGSMVRSNLLVLQVYGPLGS